MPNTFLSNGCHDACVFSNHSLKKIKSFEKVSSEKLNYKFVPRRAGDIEKVWADKEFANKELGWKAEKELDEMMLSAWNWEKAINKK